MTFQWKHKSRYIVTENETLYPLYPYSLAIELCRNCRQIKEMGLSAGTGKLCFFGHLGLVFIWSCFVFCLLLLLYYVICAPVLTERTKEMHETSIDRLGFKSCPGRAVPKSYIILNRLEYSQLSSLSPVADTPVLRTLAITDRIQIPGKSYRGLTGIMTPAISHSRYNGITDTLVVQSDSCIVLTLDKADTLLTFHIT